MPAFRLMAIVATMACPALAACTAQTGDTRPLPPAQENSCIAPPGQAFIGRTASVATAHALLAATHARELRWVPPRTAVTMEYKYGRLTVGYDDSLIITSVSCS